MVYVHKSMQYHNHYAVYLVLTLHAVESYHNILDAIIILAIINCGIYAHHNNVLLLLTAPEVLHILHHQ